MIVSWKKNNSINFNALKLFLSVLITYTTASKLSSEPKMVSNMDQAWIWHCCSLCGLENYLFVLTNERVNGKTIQPWLHPSLNLKLLTMVEIWPSTSRVAIVDNKLNLRDNYFIDCDITHIAA